MSRSWPALAVALMAAAAGACGGEREPSSAAARADADPQATQAVEPVGREMAGSVAQLADCDDWRAGSREARMATIRDIRGQHTPQRSATAASPLSDERAYEIFEKVCAQSYAGSLRLYKMYVKAQGFSPLYE